jgi:hypothetical protein
MQPWLVRGVAMAVVNAVAQTILAKFEVDHPSSTSVLAPVTLAVLVGVAGLWGGIDGWLRLAGPRRGMVWFYGSLLGGLLAGLLGVIGKALFVDETGVWALGSALTGGAAFTALLILIPAGLGLAVGSRLTAPTPKPGTATSPIADETSAAVPAAAAAAPSPTPRPSRTPRPSPAPRATAPMSRDAETTTLSGDLVADLPKPNPLPKRQPRSSARSNPRG